MQESGVEPTHSFTIEEAVRYGSIEKALLVKEIRSLQIYKQRHGSDGWVYYSAAALEKKFPYMSGKSIRRWLLELVKAGVLESCTQNKFKFDSTKSYCVTDLVANPPLTEVSPQESQNKTPIAQNEPPSLLKMSNENTQNEQTRPSHSSHSSHSGGGLAQETPAAPDYRGSTSKSKEKLREWVKTNLKT